MSDDVRREPLPEVTMSRLRRRHLNEIIAIEADVFARPWSTALFLQELSKPNRSYFVAEYDGEIIGYGGLMFTGPDTAHALNVAVTPAFHRRHVGTRLLCVLMMDAIANGVDTIYLEFRVSNVAGYTIYPKFGFEIVDMRKGYYFETGEDGIVMALKGAQSQEYRERLKAIADSVGGMTGADVPVI
ncbi:MAG TPA: ribosomal protein S18-alanine N-acetyltransferase [Actinomycetota bacterium]|nr:ribosomal protein S18-alanine N-acetyltransferase [Actinomycetota bacterium]